MARAAIACAALAFAGGFGADLVRAQTDADSPKSSEPQIKNVTLGFDGVYKVGFWTPVRITLAGGDKPRQVHLELVVPDGDGVRCAVVDQRAWELPAGETMTLMRYVKFGRVGSEITVTLRDPDGDRIVSRQWPAGRLPTAEPSTRQLIVTVGSDAGIAATLRDINRQRSTEQWRVETLVEDAADLPDRWFGYEGVDALLLTTADAQHTHEALSAEQIEALDLWVKLGGNLVLSAGVEGAAMFGESGRFNRLAPGTFVEVVRESRTDGLEQFALAERVEGVGVGGSRLPMSLFSEPRGIVLAHESVAQRVPLVIRTPHGFGQIVFCAVDIDAPPLSTWKGRPRFVAQLLPAPAHLNESESTGRVRNIGYTDISGQLRGALDQFQGVTPFAFSWVAGLIVIYILLIGPVDYFLLRKLVGNMAWTWASFPIVVVGCCGLAYYLADASRAHGVKINQVDVVDVELESGLVRGTSWSHVYSPDTQRFDLSLQPTPPGPGDIGDALLSWQGLPGDAMGGMNTQGSARLFNQPYRIVSPALPDSGPAASLVEMPIQLGSSKTLSARWWSHFTGRRLDKLAMDRFHIQLTGSIGNPLSVELKDCVLFHGNSAYLMERSLAPGETVSVGDLPLPRTLQWHLTRHAATTGERNDKEAEIQIKSWDREGGDVPRILELMMLYDAAGGNTYTRGLTHEYQDFVDLTPHLEFGRAILVGRAEHTPATLQRDGKPMTERYDRRWTWYRIVLPVAEVTETETSGGVGE